MKKIVLPLCLLLVASFSFAQDLTQNIRGKIVEKETKSEIIGANVYLISDTTKKITANTDVEGSFRLEGVPIGRHTIKVTFVGYNDVVIPNVIVNSGKETILTIEMEELVNTINEVVVTGGRKKGDVNNDMTSVSGKSFDMEQTNRYAGSRSDPGRMASNFAGVNGADDSRNDIVIRGNSPMGLLWRVEGIDILNPNHFAVPGTTGGAISMLNNKIFGNSDFMTGAFAAEFGNANAGVFDIKLRNGNNEKFEFTGQFGILGTELSGEGPVNKRTGSTFLFTYRYSTLKIFESFNIHIGTSAVPAYQDASFKLNFPTKKAGTFSLWGIGGMSNIDIILSNKNADEVELYGDNNRDQYFNTSMGVLGLTHSKSLNEKNFIRTTLAIYGSDANAKHELFYRDTLDPNKIDTIFSKMRYDFRTSKYSLNFSLTHKFSAKTTLKTGFLADMLNFNFIDSNLIESTNQWDRRLDAKEGAMLIQPYLQLKYKPSDNLTFNIGVHANYFSINSNSFSVEPRAGMRWNFAKDQTLSFGYGMHSQMQPAYIYYHQVKDTSGRYVMQNKDLGFSKAQHFVLGYERALGQSTRMIVETYYQMLTEIPIDTSRSSFSLINQGSTFSRFFPAKLENTGTGFNYGAEITIEKFFSKSYFFLVTACYYQSRYKGSDGIERNTDYNGNYTVNGLVGKEFKLDKAGKRVLTTGTKITWAGGHRYSPADTAASNLLGELVEVDSLRNSLQFGNYFRLDLKLGIKINTKKLTHEIAIDLVNVLNTKNILGLTYAFDPSNPTASPIREQYQLGFLPLFYYKVDF
jgi:hypothetical protein